MRNANRSRRAGGGFTLIELLVVIAIIALLLSLLTPSLQQAKQLAVRVQCQGMERAIGLALRTYLNEYNGEFPFRAPYWCYSPEDWGPDAWYNNGDDYHEGIGEYLNKEGGELHCSAAVAWNEQYPGKRAGWAVPSTLPTYCANRTIVSWDPTYTPHAFPSWDDCAKRIERIGKTQRNWVFADGDWRGVFQAFSLSTSCYTSDQPRFYWEPHMGGTNVVYLDGHADWVSAEKNVNPSDWPSYTVCGLDWCDMRGWDKMWD